MVAICEELLREPMLEEAVRAGDCLAMLVEYFHKRGKMREAYSYVQEMEERRIALHPYVDATILEEIFQSVGASARGGGGRGRQPAESKAAAEDDEDAPFTGGESKFGGGGGGPSSGGSSGKGGREEDEEVLDEDIQEVCCGCVMDSLFSLHRYKRRTY
jgi:hypothetical protein